MRNATEAALARLAELRECHKRATSGEWPRGCIVQQYAKTQTVKAVPAMLDALEALIRERDACAAHGHVCVASRNPAEQEPHRLAHEQAEQAADAALARLAGGSE
jgi:phage terminase Nu1 subunit (DNA packaging protein)